MVKSSKSKSITKDWGCHFMESINSGPMPTREGNVPQAGRGKSGGDALSSEGNVLLAGGGRAGGDVLSTQGNVSVHQFEIYANTLWKISCSGDVPATVNGVKLFRGEEKDEATVGVRKTLKKRDKQVLGVCLAGVLWSSGGGLIFKQTNMKITKKH